MKTKEWIKFKPNNTPNSIYDVEVCGKELSRVWDAFLFQLDEFKNCKSIEVAETVESENNFRIVPSEYTYFNENIKLYSIILQGGSVYFRGTEESFLTKQEYQRKNNIST